MTQLVQKYKSGYKVWVRGETAILNSFKTAGRSQFLSSCILLMMVLSFAAKAVLPAGFMPVVGNTGMVEIVICSGMGEKSIFVPQDSSTPAPHQQDENKSSDACAYHLAGLQKIVADAPVVFAAPSEPILETYLNAPAQIIPAPLASSVSARGPPLSV